MRDARWKKINLLIGGCDLRRRPRLRRKCYLWHPRLHFVDFDDASTCVKTYRNVADPPAALCPQRTSAAEPLEGPLAGNGLSKNHLLTRDKPRLFSRAPAALLRPLVSLILHAYGTCRKRLEHPRSLVYSRMIFLARSLQRTF